MAAHLPPPSPLPYGGAHGHADSAHQGDGGENLAELTPLLAAAEHHEPGVIQNLR
jgi:hypothetical protein